MGILVDTLTIILDGEIPLREFARTIESFYELVKALSDEVGAPDLDWVLDDLQVSSAVATVRAPSDPQSAEKVVNAYAEVGHSLETGTPIISSPRVRSAAQKVISIQDARVRSVRFETPIREAIINVATALQVPEVQTQIPEIVTASHALVVARQPALGGIQGRIQALSNRGGLRFTVYDLLYDKAIGCYIAEGKEELLRNNWGKLAIVEGVITRDPTTGRPLSIRQVSNITPLPDPSSGREYEDARGIVRPLAGLSPEEAIRRMRDA